MEMSPEESSFLRNRAEALAVVALTRRPEIYLQRGAKWSGFDLCGSLIENGSPNQQVFGVRVFPYEGDLDSARVRRIVRKSKESATPPHALEIPELLLMTDVVRDEVRYVWLKKPDKTTNEAHSLVSPSRTDVKELDAAALEEVVNSVRNWYSELESKVAA